MSIYDDIIGLWTSKGIRMFTPEEVTDGTWLKLFDHGRAFCLRLKKDGSVDEVDIWDPNDFGKSSGRWEIQGDGFNNRSNLVIRIADRWVDTFTAAEPSHLYWASEYDEDTGEEQKCRFVHVPFFRFPF